jgi:hypothetical protein
MAEETLADLFLAAGVRGQQRPRPLSMRPAWQRTPEANTPYRAPQQALADRNTLPYLRQETRNERRQQNDLAQFALEHEAARNEVNTPPGTYLGQDALEMTGLPSVARGIGHLRDQEPGQALPELALGGLGVFGMVAGDGARTPRARPPMRAALPELPTEAPRLPNAPARLPGRATDGSVLPIRPPQPFRQSMVGGSDDLAEAAAMRPQVQGDPEALSLARSWIDTFGGGPDAEARAISVMEQHAREATHPLRRQLLEEAVASVRSRQYVRGEPNTFSARVEEAWPEIYGSRSGPDARPAQGGRRSPYQEELRAQGFDVESPLYRGMTRQAEGGDFTRNADLQGSEQFHGTSFSRSTSEANLYAMEGDGGAVYPAYMRGRLESGPDYMRAVQARARESGVTNQEAARQVQQEYAQRGVTGVEWPPDRYGKGGEVRIFDQSNTASPFGANAPRTAPDGGPVQAGRAPLEFNGLKSEWNQNADGYVDLYHSGPEEVAGEFRPNTFFSSYADYNAEQFGRSEWPVMRARARIQRPYDITDAEEAAFMRADPALIERARSQGYDALRMEDASGGFEVIPLGRVERVNPSRAGPNAGPLQPKPNGSAPKRPRPRPPMRPTQ